MYHISKDKRARRSAELIWEGMEKCLQEKPLDKLRISDIYQKSYISRATFYRLFDSVQDVLTYECDQIYIQLAEELEQSVFHSRQDVFLCLIEKWIAQKMLIKTLAENNMMGVIYETHMKNSGLMKKLFLADVSLSEKEANYLVAILTNIIPAAMNIWYQHGQRETPQEIYQAVSRSIQVIGEELKNQEEQV